MIRRRDISITIALCVSLALHTALCWWMLHDHVSYLAGRLFLPGYVTKDDSRASRVVFPRLPDRFAHQMGESDGAGYASNAAPGNQAMQSFEADLDQAYLSRDPSGVGLPENLPSPWQLPPGSGGRGGRPAAPEIPMTAPETTDAAPFGANASALAAPALPRAVRRPEPTPPRMIGLPEPVRVDEEQPTTRPAEDVESDEEQPEMPPRTEVAMADPVTPARPQPSAHETPAQPAPRPGDGGAPGPDLAPADPAPESDSESDPFSKIGSAEFRPGSVQARFGRKVKTVRPRLTLAGKYDLASMAKPSLVLAVRVDETGHVRSVDVVRSSGSNEVDLPVQRAMYEWWIEPAKDKDGNPIADVMLWSLSFR
ncbi:MAG: hypothetical protein ACREIT_12225 [Tepidisphaeraceae bacterium]